MTKTPFLLDHGELVWKLLVWTAALVTIPYSIRRALRHRTRYEERIGWLVEQSFHGVLRAAIAPSLVALLLWLGGKAALKVAGDAPFEGRHDDRLGELHPVVLAAATPGHREDALAILTSAGFEFDAEMTCERRLEYGRFEELVSRADECWRPRTWKAYVQLAQGLPCDAADTLASSSLPWPDAVDLVLSVFSNLGCRRWSAVSAAADRLAVVSPEDAVWRCVSDAAAMRTGKPASQALSTSPTCFPLLVDGMAAEEGRPLLEKWLATHWWIVDITKRAPQISREEWAVSQLSAVIAMRRAPELFEMARTLERLPDASPEDLVDMLSSRLAGGLEGAPMVSLFASDLLEQAGARLPASVRIDWLIAAVVGDVLADDVSRARQRIEEVRQLAAEMTDLDAGPRPGALEWARKQAGRLAQLVNYRVGAEVDDAESMVGDIARASFQIRQGVPPQPGRHISTEILDVVKAALAGDSVPLSREFRRNGRLRRSSSIALSSLIGAMAPRVRPVPPDLIQRVETPRWSMSNLSPADFAWDAAGRRDLLRLLGAHERAERWAAMARRQWALASAPELATYYALLRDVRL
ncbi:MAG: hypothetical protein ACTHU0_05210 [Kofleriaceae bacterium]